MLNRLDESHVTCGEFPDWTTTSCLIIPQTTALSGKNSIDFTNSLHRYDASPALGLSGLDLGHGAGQVHALLLFPHRQLPMTFLMAPPQENVPYLVATIFVS